MATRLWGSGAAKTLKLSSVFRRSFSSVMTDLKHVNTREEVKLEGNSGVKATSNTRVSGKFDESQINEEMKKLLSGMNSSPKKNRTVIRTFKHLDKDEIWNIGSNIYLVDEDDIDDHEDNAHTSDEGQIGKESLGKFFGVFGNRKLVGCIRYKLDTELITVSDIETFEIDREEEK
ncbi:hypothetical protein M5689_010196 [Euphorbia peplus]|nr:hypothetical protein M5689_010196 [Euphorbia peplus]